MTSGHPTITAEVTKLIEKGYAEAARGSDRASAVASMLADAGFHQAANEIRQILLRATTEKS